MGRADIPTKPPSPPAPAPAPAAPPYVTVSSRACFRPDGTPKAAYPTRDDAMHAQASLLVFNAYTTRKPTRMPEPHIVAYRCPHDARTGHGFHLGRRSPATAPTHAREKEGPDHHA